MLSVNHDIPLARWTFHSACWPLPSFFEDFIRYIGYPACYIGNIVWCRVSSKLTIVCFGSNRNKPNLDLFRFFRETKRKFVRFVSVFRNRFGTNRNKKSAFRNTPKQKINTLLCNGHGHGHGHGRGHGHGPGHRHGHDMDLDMEMDTDTDTIFFLFRFEQK